MRQNEDPVNIDRKSIKKGPFITNMFSVSIKMFNKRTVTDSLFAVSIICLNNINRSRRASITPQENAFCRGFPSSVGMKSRPVSLIRLPNHTRNIAKASFKMLHYN